jgi:peptide/nickel transport system substrate-binding protein
VDPRGQQVPLLSSEAMGRRQFLRGIAGAGALAGAGGLLAACGSGGTSKATVAAHSSTPKRGGNLRVGLTGGSGSDTLDPHHGLTYLDTARAQALFQPLLQLDASAKTEWVLAESIESVKGSTNTKFIINLRKGVTFHDGRSLTADDVIYTFRRIKAGNKALGYSTGYPGANSLGPVDVNGLKAVNPFTVMVPMQSPFGSFVDQLAYWYYLYIVPVGFNPVKPNGTGAYVYKSFTPGQQSLFTRNPNYWRTDKTGIRLPYADTVTIIDFPDNVSLQDALVTGQIEAAGALEGPQLASLANTPGIKTVASQTGAITPFTMRVDQEPFHDVNVRQALRFIVDRQQLIDSALDGYATVGNDVFSPFDANFNHANRRQADIPQAKHLLKKAGREDLHITLTTSPVATGTVAMAQVLAQQAKAAGVTIAVNNVDPGTFFSPKNYLNSTFSQDFYNYSPYLAQVAQSMLPNSPFNETHTNNPLYNQLYQAANKTTDDVRRKQIVQEMQAFDFDKGGYIIPAYIDALDAYSTRIAGYRQARVGQPLTDLNLEGFWFV